MAVTVGFEPQFLAHGSEAPPCARMITGIFVQRGHR